MNITVEDQTGTSTNLVVDSSISAIALAFLAASELKLAQNKDLTLFEVIDSIGIGKFEVAIHTYMYYYIMYEYIGVNCYAQNSDVSS